MMAYLQPALAAIPGQPPPPHQACSHSTRNHQQQQQQQQQQRQPSDGSLHGSRGSGGQHLKASSLATLRFGDLDPAILSGGGQHGNDVPDAFAIDLNQAYIQHMCCCAVLSLLQLMLLSCQLQALLQTCNQLSTLHRCLFITMLPICRHLRAAADACGLAGSSGMQLQAAAASRYEHIVDPCSLDSRHLERAQLHFNLRSALRAAWFNALQVWCMCK